MDGVRIPSVTDICRFLAPRSWEVDEYYLKRGRIIHRITEWSDQGVLDETSVDKSLDGYLGAWQEFCNHTGFKRDHIEEIFIHHKYRYGMRIDGHGMMGKYPSVCDIKTGVPHESDLLQVPAYLFGLKENKIPTEKCFDVYLRSNGTYRLEEVKNPTNLFLKFLTGIPKWREANNGSGD
jgi:CRISPR/Cas system-associated exonuclease Cas4 (RecB family)